MCYCFFSFPDDDRDVVPLTVFDFYVDESGEFDPWQMRLETDDAY